MKKYWFVPIIAALLFLPPLAYGGRFAALIYPTQTPYPTSTPYAIQPTYTPEDTPTPYPTATFEPTFTLIPTRTYTPSPSATFSPTTTPTPTDTETPTATATETPTITPTVTPTDTPEPTYTPLPTYTPDNTPTPYPTSTPYPIQPTLTPRPTYTPQTLVAYEVRVNSPGLLNWCDAHIQFNSEEFSVLDMVADTSTLDTVPFLRVLPGNIINYSGGLLGDARVTGDFLLFTVYGGLIPPGQLPTTMNLLYAPLLRHTACFDAGVEVEATIYVVNTSP